MNKTLSKLPKILFVTGTGTDVGKTYATGWLAKKLAEAGRKVITQKLIQTGNSDMSEDIEAHRRIMGIGLQPRDIDHTTAPIILSYPASPHLAAKIDGVDVDYAKADESTRVLSEEFDNVLIEGAGGVMVPLKEDFLTIDYIKSRRLPTMVVVGGNLGSINHALLTLRALEAEGIEIAAVVYNPHFDNDDLIAPDTKNYLFNYVKNRYPTTPFLVMEEKF